MLVTILISVALIAESCAIYRRVIKSNSSTTLVAAGISFSIGIAGIALTALVLYIQGSLDPLKAPLLIIVGLTFVYQLLQIIPTYNDLKPPT